jgi:8-oxo-dGTP pyrophosphatase MutT (NUDIX family)
MDDKRWALPGGMINVGESPSAGTRREVLEETGIEIECDYLVGVYDWMLAGWPGFPGQLHSYIFSAHPVHPEAQPTRSNETLDARWFARNDLPPLSPAHDMALGHAIEFVDRKRSAPYFN